MLAPPVGLLYQFGVTTRQEAIGREELSRALPACAVAPGDASGEYWRWCPRCSHELHNEQCKLRCPRCHYFLSCSDFD